MIHAMTPAFYHIAHIIGLIFVFVGFGALLSSETSRSAMKWHGIGLVISLVSGFGLLAKLGIFATMPTWVWIKIGLWAVLGGLPVLARRRIVSPTVVMLLAVAVAGFMGYLGHLKPVM
jgi:hypothetical protein